jgi:hypothetical protein
MGRGLELLCAIDSEQPYLGNRSTKCRGETVIELGRFPHD